MRHDRVRVNGIDLAYTRAGAGPPIVLVHGFACGRRMWARQVRDLARDHAVLIYDQRGHGLSDAPAEPEAYSPGHLGRDLAGLLDVLGIGRCHVVGFSLGGGPALGLALAQPGRVASLTLADVGAGSESPMLLSAAARRWGMVGRGQGQAALVDELMRSEFFKSYADRDARSRRHMRALLASTPLEGALNTLTEVLAKRTSLFRMTGALRRVAVPTLVLRGGGDQLCRASSRLLAGTIPGAREVVLPGAGHMAPLEAPKAFARALRDHIGPHRDA